MLIKVLVCSTEYIVTSSLMFFIHNLKFKPEELRIFIIKTA